MLCSVFAKGEKMEIEKFRYAGPYKVSAPFMVDRTDVNAKEFDVKKLLDMYVAFEALEGAGFVEAGFCSKNGEHYTLNFIGVTLENSRYATATLKVEGLANALIWVDGSQLQDGKMALVPGTHQVVIKYLAAPGEEIVPKITLETEQQGVFSIREDGKRMYSITDVLHGTRFQSMSLSPNGYWLITSYKTALPHGKLQYRTAITELGSGRSFAPLGDDINWMPRSNRYWFVRNGAGGRDLVAVDPVVGKEILLARNIPAGEFRISPSEDYLLYTVVQEGPKENEGVYQVIEPDDRQPQWRKRTFLAKYDLATGVMQQLTFGYRNVWASDISADGGRILVMMSGSRLVGRPTTLYSLYLMDVATLEMIPLVENDGFIKSAKFLSEGTEIVICGSPETLGGIGKNVKDGQIPSMYDFQLYIMNLADRGIVPVTREFNPSVGSYECSYFDGYVYFNAEDKDCKNLFRLSPKSGKIEQIPVPEDLVNSFTLARSAPVIVWYGQGASNSDRSYMVDLRRGKTRLLEDLSARILNGVQLGECRGWNFTNSRGDEINGRYYLPYNFDSQKKYPLIVNYYGGCSPTERTFESRYPHHLYAAMGYVVYVINPSGATGFGQEFSARHVNTAGEGPAEDIIEGTQAFCEAHPFVDEKKIGCIGASYGGFMTQYLQTVTDIFAAAVSHAGISDHTSYWGEGYWGYSYSEVSMADSYPWSHRKLYVEQSPLYNAEKINTPILFLHGDSDVNVPVGESIQIYTALKLLGKETAMVLVKDQDHHILDYQKRIQWQNTIFAWFAKWLQDDQNWWNALYPPKTL